MAVNFEVLKGLLIRFVALRIRNGDCTERQLARLVGVSQPQLHNVLKGVRPLKQRLADALLKHFQIGLLDLLREYDSAVLEGGAMGGLAQNSADGSERRLMVLEPALNSKRAAASELRIPGQFRRRAS